MLRIAIIGLLAAGLIAGEASAQAKIDCGKAYQDFVDKLERGDFDRLSAEQRAALSRKAVRIYNACRTGDVHDPKSLFERMDSGKY